MRTRLDGCIAKLEDRAPFFSSERFPERRAVERLLAVLVVVQLSIYAVIAWLSPLFDFTAEERSRPLLAVIGLLLVNFALHLWSLALLLKLPDSRTLGWRIVLVSVAMRLILIGSTPIQEVDIYRYMWDGVVVTQAINPFRYAPLAVASETNTTLEPELTHLRKMVAEDAGIRETLRRIHFPELPTVYPPASQLVFAAAAMMTPRNSSVVTRLLITKSWMVAFDIASLGCIWLLLGQFRKHSAWLVAWGWSPLVLKEFANSGHLDSIAICLTLVATSLLVMSPRWLRLWTSGLMMGLAVASKLYPVILLPLWIVFDARRSGWRSGLQLGTLATLASVIFLLPMFWDQSAASPSAAAPAASTLHQSSLAGLSTFLTRWEMNDLLFMVVEENIRPASHVPDQRAIWFVVVPADTRHLITKQLAIWSGQPEDRLPFLATRGLTAIVFAALLLWFVHRTWREPQQLPQWIFLALAWFWFLSPTQNPWYWCWSLAFVPFANSRLWLAVSGLSLLYYLRFWFSYHAADVEVLSTNYRGASFFDFIVVWLEFAPFLLILAYLSLMEFSSRSQRAE